MYGRHIQEIMDAVVLFIIVSSFIIHAIMFGIMYFRWLAATIGL